MDPYERALAVFSRTRAHDELADVVRILLGMAAAADLLGDRALRDWTIEIAADLLADARLKRRRRPD